MSEQVTAVSGYRARVRWVQDLWIKAETSEAVREIDGVTVKLTGRTGDKPLDDQHLILNIRGLPSQQEAEKLGEQLRRGLILKSAVRRTGLDLGEDKATTQFFAGIKSALKEQGMTLRDDVHGLDVFYDDGTVGFMNFSAQGSVSSGPDWVFPDIDGSLGWVDGVPDKVLEASRLLNAADRSGPPIVTLALSIAALETLAPPLPWSTSATAALNAAIAAIDADNSTETGEKQALKQSLTPIRDFGQSGARRVKKLLEDFGLGELLGPQLSKATAVRSKLLHGTHVARSVQQDAATQARQIAHAVLLAVLGECGVNAQALLP